MLTSRRVSILGLALCAVAAGATTPALTTRVAAAPAAPKVAVVGHISTHLVAAPNSRRDHIVRQLTLHITGSNFVPGSTVSIAVMNTSTWEVLAKGAMPAQRATTSVICGHDFKLCSQPNPRAGTIDYRIRLRSAPPAFLTWMCGHEHEVCSRPNPAAVAHLLVLYRSAGDAGMQGVTLR